MQECVYSAYFLRRSREFPILVLRHAGIDRTTHQAVRAGVTALRGKALLIVIFARASWSRGAHVEERRTRTSDKELRILRVEERRRSALVERPLHRRNVLRHARG